MVVDAKATFQAARCRELILLPWEGSEIPLCLQGDYERAIDCSSETWFPVFEAFRGDLLRAGFPSDSGLNMWASLVELPHFVIARRFDDEARDISWGSFGAEGAGWTLGAKNSCGWRRSLGSTDMSETFATLLERMMADLPNPFGPPLPLHEEALEVI